MSRGGKVIISVGFLIVLILSICAFFKSDIEYMVVTKNIDRLYGTTVENYYFIVYNFD